MPKLHFDGSGENFVNQAKPNQKTTPLLAQITSAKINARERIAD